MKKHAVSAVVLALLTPLGLGCASEVQVEGAGGAGAAAETGGGGAAAVALRHTSVSAKWDHACAIDPEARLHCWGNNQYGEIGVPGAPSFVASPIHVDPEHRYREVSAGVMTTCAIREEGSLFCWGRNMNGALLTNDRTPRDAPWAIGVERDWEHVSVGSGLVCGLRGGGRLFCWGGPDYGAILEGPWGPEVLTAPKEIDGRFVNLTSHWYQTIAISRDGTLWSSENDGIFAPITVFAGAPASLSLGPLYGLVVDTEGALSRIVFQTVNEVVQTPEAEGVRFGEAISVSYHGCAIARGGELYCGGDHGSYGPPLSPLGDGMDDWQSVGSGASFACGARADGSVWCWGTLASYGDEPGVEYGGAPKRVMP